MRSHASQSVLFFFLPLSLTMAQHTGGFLNAMPKCWQTCFQSTFPKCPDQLASDKALDCVCPRATGSTFTSLISCVKQGCDDYANPLTLTAPLKAWQNACNTAGYPLTARAVQSAQDAEQSILSTYTGRSALSPTDPTTSSESYFTSAVSVDSRSTTITGTVSPSSITAETGTSTASSSSSSSTHHADSADGSPLDVTNQANKERARSLLGLTICLLAGVAWF
ncbi:hypothetical protein G7Y79_00031g065980 [Physcia stellaris]|nr:hypothetical protein G7Y79_00031g065980 [Physcia stellaris]